MAGTQESHGEAFAVIVLQDGSVHLEPRGAFTDADVPVAVAAVRACIDALGCDLRKSSAG